MGIPRANLRYLNKAGKAFGFHVENAYIENRATKRALFITVGIYTNPNRVVNDNQYGYRAESGAMFMDLGKAVGAYLRGPDYFIKRSAKSFIQQQH